MPSGGRAHAALEAAGPRRFQWPCAPSYAIEAGPSIYVPFQFIAGDNGDFAGSIDDVAFYDRALSEEAVRLHYGEHQLYSYDNLYRLTDATYSSLGVESEYSYDAVGNRLSWAFQGVPVNFEYDAANRITGLTPSGGPTFNYTWADNGNLEARFADSFSWDAADRLVSATVSGSTTTFTYNGDGLRESLTFASNTTTFTWDVNRSIPQILDDETYQYLYGLGRISQVGSSDTHYYLTDGLGSTLALTDEAGEIVNAYEYDAFGTPLWTVLGDQPNDFQFAGEQFDASTNLQYLRNRFYDMSTGTFISRDPLSASPSWSQHSFAYVGGNPISWSDPLGLSDPEGPCSTFGFFGLLEGACAKVRSCLGQGAGHALDCAIDISAQLTYGCYYASYYGMEYTNFDQMLYPSEAVCFVGDLVFDKIQGQPLTDDRIDGPICANDFLYEGCPETYFPGLGEDGVDFNYPDPLLDSLLDPLDDFLVKFFF